uniref:Putative secreted peptide n=1 Tax=Anopheles braziliensis TaxID=58242 RepID=A0A2M3ZUC6_9DIPT
MLYCLISIPGVLGVAYLCSSALLQPSCCNAKPAASCLLPTIEIAGYYHRVSKASLSFTSFPTQTLIIRQTQNANSSCTFYPRVF